MHDRAFFVGEVALLLLPDRHSNDVPGQEVGSELDPAEVEPDARRKGPGQCGLAHTGYVFYQHV